jgi:hypothetical protein
MQVQCLLAVEEVACYFSRQAPCKRQVAIRAGGDPLMLEWIDHDEAGFFTDAS